MARILWEIAAIFITLMGLSHLAGTLLTKGMHPRAPELIVDMEVAPLNLTNKLTMWKAWIGFNATHSCGIIFMGIINYYLAWKHFGLLEQDHMFAGLTVAGVLLYALFARIYWFKGVFILLLIAFLIFMAGAILMIVNN